MWHMDDINLQKCFQTSFEHDTTSDNVIYRQQDVSFPTTGNNGKPIHLFGKRFDSALNLFSNIRPEIQDADPHTYNPYVGKVKTDIREEAKIIDADGIEKERFTTSITSYRTTSDLQIYSAFTNRPLFENTTYQNILGTLDSESKKYERITRDSEFPLDVDIEKRYGTIRSAGSSDFDRRFNISSIPIHGEHGESIQPSYAYMDIIRKVIDDYGDSYEFYDKLDEALGRKRPTTPLEWEEYKNQLLEERKSRSQNFLKYAKFFGDYSWKTSSAMKTQLEPFQGKEDR